MASQVPDNGILLADGWKLVPVDERNWELCQLRPPRDSHGNPTEGEPRWFRCGRFYQYNTIDEAMLYVIDALMKDGCKDDAIALASAMRQWQQLAESVRETARSPR